MCKVNGSLLFLHNVFQKTIIMTDENLINETISFVKAYMEDKESGHNWWHIERVWKNAKYILEKEGCGDSLIVELAALIHDIGDDKIDPDTDGKKLVRAFLSDHGLAKDKVQSVIDIMSLISFRDNLGQVYKRFTELDIVQDADRLDAIGAIGIARAFAYGGSKNFEIYNPTIAVREYSSKKDYQVSDSSSINHFYEKLLLLKDRMNTETGKQMAAERHQYMEGFLAQFYSEWGV